MKRTIGLILSILGLLMLLGGASAYYLVHTNLADEKITVAEDASFLAGDTVDGPFSAYAEADIIKEHTLHSTNGKTYAELDREDPLREVAMSSSFLRASLFTSVVAFGLSALAMGTGLLSLLTGLAFMKKRDRVDVGVAEHRTA